MKHIYFSIVAFLCFLVSCAQMPKESNESKDVDIVYRTYHIDSKSITRPSSFFYLEGCAKYHGQYFCLFCESPIDKIGKSYYHLIVIQPSDSTVSEISKTERKHIELIKSRSRLYETFVKGPTVTDFRRIFTQKDSVTLDSMLFFTPNMQHIDRLYTILEELPAEECYYERLHQMYYDEGIAEALPNLCRYRREEDKATVIECLLEYSKGLDKEHVRNGPEGKTNQGLEAVAIWPDPAFLLALRKVRDYEVSRKHYDYGRIRLFYLALMAYDDDYSYNFIDNTLRMTGRDSTTRYYHLRYFREAYDRSPNSRYESLLKKYDKALD